MSDAIQVNTDLAWTEKWNSYKVSGSANFSAWRPTPPSGWANVGDKMKNSWERPGRTDSAAFVRDDNVMSKPPLDYEEIWNSYLAGGNWENSCWRPIPPPGYTAVGCLFSGNYSKPSLNDMRCIRTDLILIFRENSRSFISQLWKYDGALKALASTNSPYHTFYIDRTLAPTWSWAYVSPAQVAACCANTTTTDCYVYTPTGADCSAYYNNTCKGAALATAGCKAYCNKAGDPCNAELVAFCAGSEDKLKAYPELCGCHMGPAHYSAFFKALSSAATAFVPPYEYCYFGQCANGTALQTAGTKQPCANVTVCTSNITLENSGVIKGAINVTQSASCGNSPGTGTNIGTGTSGVNEDEGSSLLVPSLPAELFGLSQTTYLAASGGLALFAVIGFVILITTSKPKLKKRRGR
jgi:hypothetical protein